MRMLQKIRRQISFMKVFLCGGGAGIQTAGAYKRLREVIDRTKPCLYIPLAMEPEQYGSCREWIQAELKDIGVPFIEMVKSAEELAARNLPDFGFLFLGGGNTFKLLSDLKASGAFEKIKAYLEQGGVVFGGSAGAIIFGKDLEACRLDDANKAGLRDTDGFDLLNGASVLCHYTNRAPEKDERSQKYLLEISKHRKAIALPEEVTLFINGNTIEVIGSKPYYLFQNGVMLEQNTK